MTLICTPATARRLPRRDYDNARWVHIGQDLEKRRRIASVLGEKTLLRLGDRLHLIAEQLRQPFLDFIADLGKLQPDKFGWWSSSCSWKESTTSDFFLLVCYAQLVGQLLRDWESTQGTLVVVIEDAWLFRQLQGTYGNAPSVTFGQAGSLWPSCARSFLIGCGARAAWTVRLLISSLKQKWFCGRRRSRQFSEAQIGLYSFPLERCVRGTDEWEDPCLGALDSILEKSGYHVCRFSPPQRIGYEKALARRRHYFVPLILYVPLLQLLGAAFAFWRAQWPKTPEIGGQPVRWLLLREWWKGSWHSSYMLQRVFFIGLTRFMSFKQLKLIIYPCENQPWEKILVLASRVHGIPTLGYQHGAGLARFMLSYFLGDGEAAWAPLPDLIVTSAPYSRDVLLKGGTPPERLVVGGSLRYQYLRSQSVSMPMPEPGARVRILVALPVEAALSHHLLQALKRAFPDGGMKDGLEFVMKSHPECPISERSLAWPAPILSGTFQDAIRSCPMAVYSGTSAGMEALMMGRTVIRYRSELLLNRDPGEFLPEDEVVDVGDYDLREKLLCAVKRLADQHSRHRVSQEMLDHIYAPVNETIWSEAVNRLCLRA